MTQLTHTLGLGVAFAIAAVTCFSGSAASAAVVTFDESGYTTGGVSGQQGDATADKWSDWGSPSLVVADSVGVSGSRGLQTAPQALSSNSAEYRPTAAEFDDVPFDAAASVVSFSIDIKLASAIPTGDLYRAYIGFQSSSIYGVDLRIQGDGDLNLYRTNGGPSGTTLVGDNTLADNAFHTVSGTLYYETATYDLSIDGTQVVTGRTFDRGAGNHTTYGGWRLNTRESGLTTEDDPNFIVVFDNLELTPVVPEPGALGLLAAGATLMLSRRRGH